MMSRSSRRGGKPSKCWRRSASDTAPAARLFPACDAPMPTAGDLQPWRSLALRLMRMIAFRVQASWSDPLIDVVLNPAILEPELHDCDHRDNHHDQPRNCGAVTNLIEKEG